MKKPDSGGNHSCIHFIVLVFSVLLFTSCATAPKVPLAPNHIPLRHIALLSVPEPAIRVWSNPVSRGLSDYLRTALEGVAEVGYAKNIKDKNINFGAIFTDEIKKELESKGVVIDILQGTEIKNDKGRYDLQKIHTNADAILYVVFDKNTGYYEPRQGFAVAYEPLLIAWAVLINPKNRQIFYQQSFYAGFDPGVRSKNVEYVPFRNKEYLFNNLPGDEETFNRSIEGIKFGLKKVAEAIAMQLRH